MEVRWHEEGTDPDYRFSLANERTFLAWIRTALAILAGAILLHQIGVGIEPHYLDSVVSGGLSLLAATLGVGAYLRWRGNEIAMRQARSLPRSTLVPLLAACLSLLGLATLVILFLP